MSAEDTDTVRVCPECQQTEVTPISDRPGGGQASADYRCEGCGAEFDEFDEREPKHTGGLEPRNGLAAKLHRASPDDLATDGGEQQ